VAESPVQPRTVPALWRAALAEGRTTTAYLEEKGDGWTPVSWEQAGERVSELANGLLALGIRKGDAFGILASTCLEWALFDYALALVGAVTVPIYATSSPDDCAYALEHAEAVGVLAEDAEQVRKLDERRAEIPRVRHVLTFADLDDLAARGRAHAAGNPGALDEAIAAVGEADLYTFIYTSGTTGRPKACMITHRNACEQATAFDGEDPIVGTDDVVLLWLPLAHNFGRFLCLSGVHRGFTIGFLADPHRLTDALPHLRPTLFPSVPRIFEKVYEATQKAFAEQTGARRKLVHWALGVGRRASALRQEGKDLPLGLSLQHRLADRLVYSKVKRGLGGRVRMAVSGAAPISLEVLEFFHALDVLILEGYGLTECTSGASVNRPHNFRFGTVGLPLPTIEARTAEDGELLLRGPTIFAGYYRDDQATREVLGEDGWLRTGDVAEIDADGFIKITDRKKDILVTAGGKKVAPQNLENRLKGSKYVSQALVVGDRRPYVAAIVSLDEEAIGAWADEHGLPRGVEELSRNPDVVRLVQAAVDEANRGRTSFEQIKRFAILPRDFSADEGEVTPTLKLRRRVAEQHFTREIDELYGES
jgi:long-chain acyl-CoA synthetase